MDNEKQNCKVCGEAFDSDALLHKHFRSHKLSIGDYYQKYYPRFDKLTGEKINFKSKEQYLSSHFNCKKHLIEWFKSAKETDAKEYTTDFLKDRIEKGKMIYAPTQVELRSLMCPPLITIEKYFGDKVNYFSSLGLKIKFKESSYARGGYIENSILIDTREQTPLVFQGVNTKITGLKYGDYRLEKSVGTEDICVIERKSPKDFVSTFSNDLERFERELQRAINDKAYLVVLIEESLTNMLDFKNKSDSFQKTKITPEYLFKNVRDLLQRYDKIQFLFTNGREEAARVTKKILIGGYLHKDFDLQLLYDKKEL